MTALAVPTLTVCWMILVDSHGRLICKMCVPDASSRQQCTYTVKHTLLSDVYILATEVLCGVTSHTDHHHQSQLPVRYFTSAHSATQN